MGMFDYVNVEIPCPYCGSGVDNFQSKDYICDMLTIDPHKVNRFYSNCKYCGERITFTRATECEEHRDLSFGLEEILNLGFVLEYK
jgi:DNA-directed RNA polymerase subunit RPC12/RpoP